MRTRTLRTVVVKVGFTAAALFALAYMSATPARADFRLGVDDWRMTYMSNASDWTPLVQSTKASIVREIVDWSQIAATKPGHPADPTDPAYDWRSSDRIVRIAAASGAEVLFSTYSAPTWAEGAGRPSTGYGPLSNQAPYRGSWKPDVSALGQFAEALAKRYSGSTEDPLDPSRTLPRVRLFEAWNEPNYKMYLTPQCDKGKTQASGTCSSSGKLVVIDQYRLMLNAFFDGINRGQPAIPGQSRPVVSVGGLGPYGSSSQGYEVDPQKFARQLMCLSGSAASPRALSGPACPVKAKLDALSFHPYTFDGTPTTKAYSSDGGSLGNAPDLQKALTVATSSKTILPSPGQADFQAKELWETETGWLTCPPCRATSNPGKPIGIDSAKAAAYTAESIYRAWSWGVKKIVWFALADSDGNGWPGGLFYLCPNGATSTTAPCQSAKLSDAVAKPGLQAFRFPVFAAKSGSKAFAWAMSPCKVSGSTLTFEVLNSKTKAWSQLMTAGPIDSKTHKATSVPVSATLPTDTDGTAKTGLWAIPANTASIRAVAGGAGCSTERSIAVSIAAK